MSEEEFDLEAMIPEIEEIERRHEDHNFGWIIEERLVETRSSRENGIDTDHRDYERLQIRGYALDVEITPEEINMPHIDDEGDHLSDTDRDLYNYLSGLK